MAVAVVAQHHHYHGWWWWCWQLNTTTTMGDGGGGESSSSHARHRSRPNLSASPIAAPLRGFIGGVASMRAPIQFIVNCALHGMIVRLAKFN